MVPTERITKPGMEKDSYWPVWRSWVQLCLKSDMPMDCKVIEANNNAVNQFDQISVPCNLRATDSSKVFINVLSFYQMLLRSREGKCRPVSRLVLAH